MLVVGYWLTSHKPSLSDGVNDPDRTENWLEVPPRGCCEQLEMTKVEETEQQTTPSDIIYYSPHFQGTFVLAVCRSLV